MTIQVTGKNVAAGDNYSSYVTERLLGALDKYVGSEVSGHVRLEKERGRFRTSCSVRLRSGLLLEASGGGGDAYASADNALERLEKRVRRHRRRLKSHHLNGHSRRSLADPDVGDQAVTDDDEPVGIDGSPGPVVVAEASSGLRELSVGEAVMQLDLTSDAFLLFRNAGNGAMNVVYRRGDGNIGWIDPRPGGTTGNGTGRTGNA